METAENEPAQSSNEITEGDTTQTSAEITRSDTTKPSEESTKNEPFQPSEETTGGGHILPSEQVTMMSGPTQQSTPPSEEGTTVEKDRILVDDAMVSQSNQPREIPKKDRTAQLDRWIQG